LSSRKNCDSSPSHVPPSHSTQLSCPPLRKALEFPTEKQFVRESPLWDNPQSFGCPEAADVPPPSLHTPPALPCNRETDPLPISTDTNSTPRPLPPFAILSLSPPTSRRHCREQSR
jgi:hypothetical protein